MNNKDFAVCMLDADNFKPFNDYYGYSRGNLVIKYIASLMKKAIKKYGTGNDFVGHIGGDDFVIICEIMNYQDICRYIIEEFDKNILNYYDKAEAKLGYIESKDRLGNIKNFSAMSLTISVIDSKMEEDLDFFSIGEKLAKLKTEGKNLGGSNIILR